MESGDFARRRFRILLPRGRQQQDPAHGYDEEYGLLAGAVFFGHVHGGIWQGFDGLFARPEPASACGPSDVIGERMGTSHDRWKTTPDNIPASKQGIADSRGRAGAGWKIRGTVGTEEPYHPENSRLRVRRIRQGFVDDIAGGDRSLIWHGCVRSVELCAGRRCVRSSTLQNSRNVTQRLCWT